MSRSPIEYNYLYNNDLAQASTPLRGTGRWQSACDIPWYRFLTGKNDRRGLFVKLAFLASMMAGGAQLLPRVTGWAQPPDVRTEAIVTAAILLGVAALLRRNKVTRSESQEVASSLRDAA
jgi:hypothetical protein